MEKKHIIDELFEFTEKLIVLIKQDWEKSKKFIKEHKKYFFWILTLFASLQFTNILSIGNSWSIYCKENGIQMNGGGNLPGISTPMSMKSIQTDTTKPSSSMKEMSKTESIKKAPQKSKFGRMKSGISRNIRNNPVLGNMDKIFNMTQSMFAIIIFILIVVGVLSLPVIIFIIITYCIIKNILSRLAIL